MAIALQIPLPIPLPIPTGVLDAFASRADIADLALLLWALTMTAAFVFALREAAAAIRRFDTFLAELARFNERFDAERSDTNAETRPRPPPPFAGDDA